jgi:hypothetical protein
MYIWIDKLLKENKTSQNKIIASMEENTCIMRMLCILAEEKEVMDASKNANSTPRDENKLRKNDHSQDKKR